MMKVNLCGVTLKNPVIAASGTFGFGREYAKFFNLDQLGGMVSKGLTLNPKEGNRGLRIHETTAGIMNSIGLQNPGIKAFIDTELKYMLSQDTETIANLGGNSLADYVEGAKLLNATDLKFIELNISCPNIKEGGMAFGITCDSAEVVVKAVREVTDKILIVKLSPNAHDIKAMAQTCVAAGADALSLVNTFNALAIDVETRKPYFENVTAGLSGPCIKPIALRMVREVASVVEVPIIGLGGIMNANDALEFIMAGATAVQVGTANFTDPTVMLDIIQGIEAYMVRHDLQSLEEIRGII